MEAPGPATLGAAELGESLLRLGTWCGVGSVIGALSAFGMYKLYPPTGTGQWLIPTLAAATLVVLATLYGVAVRLGDPRSADWLVLGFTAALVLATGLVVARELLVVINDDLPAMVWSEGVDALREHSG